jgi:ADP-ribosylarginine hydrolase
MINDDVKDSHGGVLNIRLDKKNWMISDDTVMHIATAEALVSDWRDTEQLYSTLASKYKECMHDMKGRAPGLTCMTAIRQLRPLRPQGYVVPFNPKGGGCGAAMRSAPIGLLYHDPARLDDLIAIAIESGRMTHNHPTGHLGSLATALFVSYAIQGKPLVEWGSGLMDALDQAWSYIKAQNRDVKDNKIHWNYFKEKWEHYLSIRGILDGHSMPQFPIPFDFVERDAFYKSVSYSGCGGASGHDAPMIAYDALLGCGDSWEELCKRGMFHAGDSDSTGIIAGACWGAMKGFECVPAGHYDGLEYKDRLNDLGDKLYTKFSSSI